MAVLASAIAPAVASETQRKTLTGDTCRSAIAPKINGETNAARAEEANAYGLIACNPCASNTRLSGTIHIPRAAPWMKNSAISSAYSAFRMVLSTATERTGGRKFQAAKGG